MACGPDPRPELARWLCLSIKFYWHTATLFDVPVACGYVSRTQTKLSGPGRLHKPIKPEIFVIRLSTEKVC